MSTSQSEHAVIALQTCIREMEEEIGINLKQEDFTSVGIRKSPGDAAHKRTAHFYVASIDEKTKIHLNDESRGYAWFSTDEIPDKTMDPKTDIFSWWSIIKKNHSEKQM